ncbi:right-handed parallel beta-helix repeat-containing protein [Methylocapsa sp. S129]|uniref:right-handed parallel beta-helix repeat-containing protein n=1 Tax=Methylocapsa sp. S129 TaxID=1641869 RepID=UPI00131E280B|nr:right-handed parallel beta-helix repeat-containing protein [Methylocapsa sp. S129]
MIKTCLLTAAALTAFGLALPPAYAQTATRAWVSGKGADAAGCGSPASPCRSFQYVHDNIIAAAGEIDVLDPAGYGPITITKALSIVNDGVGTAGVQQGTAGLNAITINAGTSDAVTLRGLNIDGLGIGANGVVFNSGASMTVVNCVIRHFAYTGSQSTGNGIYISPTTSSSRFVISGATVSDNGYAGILFYQTAATNAFVVIDHTLATANKYGIVLGQNAGGSTAKLTISNSVSSNNDDFGISIGNGGGTMAVTLDATEMNNNNNGIVVSGTPLVLMGRSVIASNLTGVTNNTSPNSFYTYGDNRINGNNPDISGTALATNLKPQ